MCVCLRVCARVCLCVCRCVCELVCVENRSHCLDSPLCPHFRLWDKFLIMSSLFGWMGRESLEIVSCLLPSTETMSAHNSVQFSMWVLSIQTQVLKLGQKMLYWLSHLLALAIKYSSILFPKLLQGCFTAIHSHHGGIKATIAFTDHYLWAFSLK